ncbi:MAG: serine hydroxymethyltransferase, partial [Lachnospiraceae bacterium]|nr:serine hydroxymethyltransferase [Lachnospiraceae bacterium]
AKALAGGLINRGMNIVTGGTDNHLMLLDLRGTGITGKVLEARLDEAHITANKNTVPGDPESPFVTSGVRLGTPAVTTRGLNAADMDLIAEAISLTAKGEEHIGAARQIVKSLTDRYPLEP